MPPDATFKHPNIIPYLTNEKRGKIKYKFLKGNIFALRFFWKKKYNITIHITIQMVTIRMQIQNIFRTKQERVCSLKDRLVVVLLLIKC